MDKQIINVPALDSNDLFYGDVLGQIRSEARLASEVVRNDIVNIIDSRGYVTEDSSNTLEIFSGGSLSLNPSTEGKMRGFFISSEGYINGIEVHKGESWVFVNNGIDWDSYKAGISSVSGGNIPNSPSLSISSVSSSELVVSWDNVSGASSYEGRINGGQIKVVESPWKITGLSESTSYVIDIRAVSSYGNSGWSSISTSTSEKQSVPLQFSSSFIDSTYTIFSTDFTNDSVTITNGTYGKHARSVSSIPVGGSGYFEVVVPESPTGNGLPIELTNYAVTSQSLGGIKIQPTGIISKVGGVWSGGVDSGATLSSGNKFRLFYNSSTSTIATDQYNIGTNSWVRIMERVVSTAPTAPLYLDVGYSPNINGTVKSLRGVTS